MRSSWKQSCSQDGLKQYFPNSSWTSWRNDQRQSEPEKPGWLYVYVLHLMVLYLEGECFSGKWRWAFSWARTQITFPLEHYIAGVTMDQCLRFLDIPSQVSHHTENNREEQKGRWERERKREKESSMLPLPTTRDSEYLLEPFLCMFVHTFSTVKTWL